MIAAFIIHILLSNCRENVLSFIDNEPEELNDADLKIARLRLSPPYVKHRSVLYVLCPEAMFGKSAVVRAYPHYKTICPNSINILENYDELLQKESDKRMHIDAFRSLLGE